MLDFKNLPEPENSKEINIQFHGTKDLELDINNFDLSQLNIQEDLQAQIKIPPKQ